MLFVSLQTQWNYIGGFGGGARVGLQYPSVYPILDRLAGDDREKWDRLFSEIRSMERVVLAIPAAE